MVMSANLGWQARCSSWTVRRAFVLMLALPILMGGLTYSSPFQEWANW